MSAISPGSPCTDEKSASSHGSSGGSFLRHFGNAPFASFKITAPNVVLTNQSDQTRTLTLVVDNPGSVTLQNGGKKGTDFSLGGSISLSSATAGGVYAGTFDVTVDY